MVVVSGHDHYLMQRLRRKPAPFLAVVEHDAHANSGSGPLHAVTHSKRWPTQDDGPLQAQVAQGVSLFIAVVRSKQ